jgi:vacuolar protein sorting-associated protein 3
VRFGEAFVTESEDTATEFVNADRERVRRTLDGIESELSRIDGRMGELKKSLYGRFGKGIHLENDDDEDTA